MRRGGGVTADGRDDGLAAVVSAFAPIAATADKPARTPSSAFAAAGIGVRTGSDGLSTVASAFAPVGATADVSIRDGSKARYPRRARTFMPARRTRTSI